MRSLSQASISTRYRVHLPCELSLSTVAVAAATLEHGEEVLITKRRKPVALFVAVPGSTAHARTRGCHRTRQ